FGPDDDVNEYPRTLEADLQACRAAGVDLVFAPKPATMYPPDEATTVHVRGLTESLCGRSRQTHFDGVATVVVKLFNILPATMAFFGEKDYQQLVVVKRAVRDLNIPIEIVACPTVREPDGLAFSSRNQHLLPDERKQATSLSRALFAAAKRISAGEQDTAGVVQGIRDEILRAGPAEIDYIDVVDAMTLASMTIVDRPARICLAVRIGACRLIDNVGVDRPAESK
ncbi:MAG: pantoate--beta-alanine ligase, partial [Planctomycetes bacterium]|nr:pantoate--beta-alanine ligase [Planctomycetota bacterium]